MFEAFVVSLLADAARPITCHNPICIATLLALIICPCESIFNATFDAAIQ